MKKIILLLSFVLMSISIHAQIIINYQPDPLVVCDEDNNGYSAHFELHEADADITLGDPNLIVTYHPTQSDAENDLSELPNPYSNDDPYDDVVFARVEDGTGNYATTTLVLEVRDRPILTLPSPLSICDDNADGLEIFDLTSKNAELLASLDPTKFDVYFYEIEMDAVMAGDMALSNPDFSQAISSPTTYQNTTNPQTVYALAVGNATYTNPNNGGTGCYDLVPLTLRVLPLPNPNQPTPLEVCDDNNDGFAQFDLTTKNEEIANGAPDLIITYHVTLDDAENGTFVLEDPYEIIVANAQTIYVRVENSISGCYTIITLQLIVNPSPEITQPDNLYIDEGDGDGFAIFDLTVQLPFILSGLDASDYLVNFYLTQADALTGANPLASPQSFGNTSNPQTIYARVENFDTGCYAITSFEILTDETAPDADGDGIANESEDLNNNGNLNDDDTDGDGIPNYLDADDDGDNVSTIDETTGIGAGFSPSYTFIDTDGDGIENYLDNDDDGDGTLTIDEDYNNNGTPIDDDTNNNGIPDFLDAEVFLSVNAFSFEDLTVYPNPTLESFTIQSSKLVSETTVLIYDIQGKILLSEKNLPQNGTLKLDVSSLENGVYFLKISSDGNTAMKKLIKE